MNEEEISTQETKLSKKASKSAWILFGGTIIVFFIIIILLKIGEEKKIPEKMAQSVSESMIKLVEEVKIDEVYQQQKFVIIENLSDEDRRIVERIREIGNMMDISETIVREAEYIVYRSEEEKSAFAKLLITDPGYIAPYSAEWRIWYSFGEDSAIFPGSPARRFAMSVARSITE